MPKNTSWFLTCEKSDEIRMTLSVWEEIHFEWLGLGPRIFR